MEEGVGHQLAGEQLHHVDHPHGHMTTGEDVSHEAPGCPDAGEGRLQRGADASEGRRRGELR
jgi:hypothetical protein